ncbi:MAG: hypothetical protein U0575_05985 [Phycisphaerales bacterium]
MPRELRPEDPSPHGAAPRTDRFPDETQNVRDLLVAGLERDAVRHVMGAYRSALCAYFAGSSFRRRFPADETPESAVDEFFAEQVLREGFLRSWLGRGSRFRYWLLVAFVNHLRHRLRREHSEHRRRERLAERIQRPPRDAVRDRFEAELVRGLAREAMAIAEAECRSEGRGDDWRTFLAHVIDGRSYNELAAQESMTYRQVANRVRFAGARVGTALRRLLVVDGCAKADLDREILHSIEVLTRCHA